jgi:hypothetical protein
MAACSFLTPSFHHAFIGGWFNSDLPDAFCRFPSPLSPDSVGHFAQASNFPDPVETICHPRQKDRIFRNP